jgi:hypothetical protein
MTPERVLAKLSSRLACPCGKGCDVVGLQRVVRRVTFRCGLSAVVSDFTLARSRP